MANGISNPQDEADARFLETMRRLKGGTAPTPAAPAAPAAIPLRTTAEQNTANAYGFDTPIASPPTVSPTATPPPVSQIKEPSIQRKAYNQTSKLGIAAPPSVEQKADGVLNEAGFNSAPSLTTPPPMGTAPPAESLFKEPRIQRKAYNQTSKKRTPVEQEADGVLDAVGFGNPQEPTPTATGKPSVLVGRKLGDMSPEERAIWTKEPQGIVGFDKNGLLTTDMTDYGSANRDAVNAWENKELGFNSKARNARIEYYRGAIGSLTDPADKGTYEAEIKRLEGLARPNA